MARKTSNCAICENSNQASICSICVNYRLNEYNTSLKSLKDRRDSLYSKLSEVLVQKSYRISLELIETIPAGVISPFWSIVVGPRIRSRIDCLMISLFRGSVSGYLEQRDSSLAPLWKLAFLPLYSVIFIP
ncbi:hypothetical protein ACSQ67_016742 [Phaseolus vulgaris]